jgi:gluconolactonase
LPRLPDAMIDLNTDAGVELVRGQWRYHDAEVATVDFRSVGEDLDPTGPPNRTYDIVPHAEVPDYDDSRWEVLPASQLDSRRGTGKVCFNWYRIEVTIPERVGKFDIAGATVVFEVIVDDYAEVWVNGKLPRVVGQAGGTVVSGFNSPNRIILARGVRPGQRFQIAVFGINAPLSASPNNYIWLRTATLDFYSAQRSQTGWEVPFEIVHRDGGLDAIASPEARLEQVAGDFGSAGGPVWVPDGYLLFSSPAANTIYRWAPDATVNVFRAKSGYNGFDIGEFPQPGSNGLTFDPSGRLTICQHGHRRIIRVEPRNKFTVLADQYQGSRLNSPNDLVYRSDGALYFTDPPFGLPQSSDDPRRELPFSGVFRWREGAVTLLTDELSGPAGVAFSPDERYLYVGNRDQQSKTVMRYPVRGDGTLSPGEVFCDMTVAPGADAVSGLKVDQAGNLYVCGPGGVWILSSEGKVLGQIIGPEIPQNLAWGDEEGQTLYMTANTGIYRIRLSIPGVRP